MKTNKNFQIFQKYFTESEGTTNYLVLIEFENLILKHTYVVAIPDWFKYYDEILKHLPACLN
jgi:hypothetical protein